MKIAQEYTIKPRDKGSRRLENIIESYKSQGFDIVADFLETRSKRGTRKGTSVTFSIGLRHLSNFIEKHYDKKYNIQTIVDALKEDKLDVYKMFKDYVSYLDSDDTDGLSVSSIRSYVIAARSYIQHNDIVINSDTFNRKVGLPSVVKEKETPIDANAIREMLNHCTNRRLKAYLLVLASSGMRATEALAMRIKDIDFGNSLVDKTQCAKVRVRGEFTKTKQSRDVFISSEAAKYLNEWILWKYRDRTSERKYYKLLNRVQSENDLIFSTVNATNPKGIYFKILEEFQRVLKLAGLDSRKEGGKKYKRREITFHSLRRFNKSTISNQTGKADFSEYILGHQDTYYNNTAEESERLYLQAMQYLTFLDTKTMDQISKDIKAQLRGYKEELEAKDKRIAELEAKMQTKVSESKENADKIGELAQMYKQLQKEIDEMKAANKQS